MAEFKIEPYSFDKSNTGACLVDINLDGSEDVLIIPDNVTEINCAIPGHFKKIVFPKHLKYLEIEKLIPQNNYCSADRNLLTCEIYDFRKCYKGFCEDFYEDFSGIFKNAFYETIPWSENFQFCLVLFREVYILFHNKNITFTPYWMILYPFRNNTFCMEDNEVSPFSPKFEKEISDLFFSRLDIDIIIEIIKHCSKPRELTLYLIEFFRSTGKHEHQIELMNLLKNYPVKSDLEL